MLTVREGGQGTRGKVALITMVDSLVPPDRRQGILERPA